jgi:hypothetical protein
MNQSVAKPIATGSRRDLQHGFPPVIDTVYSFDDAKAALATSPTASYSARSSSAIEHGALSNSVPCGDKRGGRWCRHPLRSSLGVALTPDRFGRRSGRVKCRAGIVRSKIENRSTRQTGGTGSQASTGLRGDLERLLTFHRRCRR